MMKRKTVRLDVREEIHQGREPFSRILQTVQALKANEDLLLIAPFEPKPLFGVLGQQGFFHRATPVGEDYEVLFSREPLGEAAAATSETSAKATACSGPPVLEVDARGLEPPQPLVRILEAIESLPQGVRLRARTDRRPMHLYSELEQRGLEVWSEELADGSFVTYVEGH